ncbi:hypothetical protein ABT160_30700 [Streptomyces sp. NPDC001941]|uniref:hypothetical protein n=1 Tax=Streptomyces sp. NPDC001941 TaxID=3154659 RepID=UPI00331C2B67
MNGPLLGQRAALVLVLGVLVGVGAGWLSGLEGGGPARAVLVGCAAFAAAVAFFDSLIEEDRRR